MTPTLVTGYLTQPTPAVDSFIQIDGLKYAVEGAGRAWSIGNPDPNTLRFEVRSGDMWHIDAKTQDRERSQIDGYPNLFMPGQTVSVDYQFMVESGPLNTARWLVMGQVHDTAKVASPPISFNLIFGEHMAVSFQALTSQAALIPLRPYWTMDAVGSLPTQSVNYYYIYQDPLSIVRGHLYTMSLSFRFDNVAGFIKCTRDGVSIIDYHGPLGMGYATYWSHGIYRALAAETIAMRYSNLRVVVK